MHIPVGVQSFFVTGTNEKSSLLWTAMSVEGRWRAIAICMLKGCPEWVCDVCSNPDSVGGMGLLSVTRPVISNWGEAFLFHYVLQDPRQIQKNKTRYLTVPYWYDGNCSWYFGITCLMAVTSPLAGYMLYIGRFQDNPHASSCGYSLWGFAQVNTQMNRKKEPEVSLIS